MAKTVPLNYNPVTSASIQTAIVNPSNNVVAQHSHNINHNISLTQPNHLNNNLYAASSNTPTTNSNADNSREAENDENKSAEYPEFNEYFGPPSSYFSTKNKYENVANPFADPDFDFDKFLTNVSNGQFRQMREKAKPRPKQRPTQFSSQSPRLVPPPEPKLRTKITQAIQQQLTPPPEPQPILKNIQTPKFNVPFKSKLKPIIVHPIRQTSSVTLENYITPKYVTKTYPYTPKSQIVPKIPISTHYPLTTIKPQHSKYFASVGTKLPKRIEHRPNIKSVTKAVSTPKFIPITLKDHTSTVPPLHNEYYYYDDDIDDKEVEKETKIVTNPTTTSSPKKIYSSRIKPEAKPNEDYYYEYYDYPEQQEKKPSNVNKSGEIKYSAKYHSKPDKISKITRRPITTTIYPTTQKIFSSESFIKYYTTQKPRNLLTKATTKSSRNKGGQRLTDSDAKQR